MLLLALQLACLGAAPTPYGPSFALAVQVQPGAWIGPVSLSPNGHFAIPLPIGNKTFYAPLLALAHPRQPDHTTGVVAPVDRP